MRPVVTVKRVVFLGEVGDEEAETSGAVVVAERHAHAALLAAVLAHRHPARKGCLLECAVPSIEVKEIRHRIVGDIKIWPTVVVRVEPRDAEPEAAGLIRDAGGLAGI